MLKAPQQLHTLLASAQDEIKLSGSRPGRLTVERMVPGSHWADLDVMKRNTSAPAGN